MRKILYLILTLAVLAACSGQDGFLSGWLSRGDKQDEPNRIREFYLQYGRALRIENDEASWLKRDSLMGVFCSEKLRTDTEEDRMNPHGVGYDFPTDDCEMDCLSDKTLSVEQTGVHTYTVKYQLSTLTPQYTEEIRWISLRVEMTNGRINKVTRTDEP